MIAPAPIQACTLQKCLLCCACLYRIAYATATRMKAPTSVCRSAWTVLITLQQETRLQASAGSLERAACVALALAQCSMMFAQQVFTECQGKEGHGKQRYRARYLGLLVLNNGARYTCVQSVLAKKAETCSLCKCRDHKQAGCCEGAAGLLATRTEEVGIAPAKLLSSVSAHTQTVRCAVGSLVVISAELARSKVRAAHRPRY